MIKTSKTFIPIFGAFALASLTACANTSASKAANSEHQAPNTVELTKSTAEIKYNPAPGLPGVETALVYGNPSESGLYSMRVRVAAGILTPPHFHDQDRQITVIDGDWAFGLGEARSCADTVTVEPGGVALHPEGIVHYDGSCSGQVVVQINGIGPVKTTLVSDNQ